MADLGGGRWYHGRITTYPVRRTMSIVEAPVLVEVKYHQHICQTKSLGVQLYPTGFVPATLPLDHPGLARSRRPRPVPVGSGLAGGVLAVRVADLVVADGADGTELLAPGAAGPVRDGDLVAWCTVVAVTPAVLDEDGRVGAEGWLPDHVRLGGLEEHLGDGVVERAVAQAAPAPTQPERRRLMSLPLVARLVMAMTLLPNASYVEAFAQLVGVLPRLPWLHAWQVPESTVVTTWRRRLGVAPMRALFARVAGHIVAATDPGALWHGLRVCTLDGCQVRVPDSPENRAAFGSSGTADDSASFPMVRVVMAVARAGRALLAATVDASRVGEQPLTARLVAQHPDLFTPEHVYVLDRNFFSIELVEQIHRRGQGAHLVMRMKAGIRLPVVKRLSDGDYLSWIRTPDKRALTVRVVEYDVRKPDASTSELFCLLTTLTDEQHHSRQDIAGLYPHRWVAAETTIGENKSTITDAGPSRGPILRSETPEMVSQEIWSWLAATQLVRRAAHTAATAANITTDAISFTTVRREAIRSMTQSQVTATTPTAVRAEAAGRAHRHILANKVITNRDRHSPRRQKWRPRFPHTSTTKPTSRGPLTPRFGMSRHDTS
jgi:Insertion element 4 transposase N-terminal/Transposase DDE domain